MEELAIEMLEKTEKMKTRFDQLTEMVSDPAVIADNKEWKKLVKERAGLEDLANAYEDLKKMYDELVLCREEC